MSDKTIMLVLLLLFSGILMFAGTPYEQFFGAAIAVLIVLDTVF